MQLRSITRKTQVARVRQGRVGVTSERPFEAELSRVERNRMPER